MTPDQIEQLQKSLISAVEVKIESTVNGKIDRLKKMMEDQNKIMEEQKEALIIHTQEDKLTAYKLENYITKDEQEWKEWKIMAQPSLDLGTNLRGFGKVLAYLVGTIGAIAGAIAGVVALIRKFK